MKIFKDLTKMYSICKKIKEYEEIIEVLKNELESERYEYLGEYVRNPLSQDKIVVKLDNLTNNLLVVDSDLNELYEKTLIKVPLEDIQNE